MKYLIIILGLVSVFGSCNKSVTIQLKLYSNDKAVIGDWSQVSGPSVLKFDKTHDSVVNVTGSSPAKGTYVIQAKWNGITTISIGTVK